MVVDRIGSLITNEPALGRGMLGIVDDAAVVIVDGTVAAIGPAGTLAGDERVDADGACVLPGFVDSHTHLVFAGDRAAEFTARMAGQPYDGGGIRVTTAATRAASDDELRRLLRARLDEARRSGTTTVEIKSGYGLTVDDEARLLRLAAEVTTETTFLGAHLVPAEYADRVDDYVALVCGPMLDAARPYARWIDAFCETGRVRRRPVPRRPRRPGAPPASVCACTATSSATGRACNSPSSWAARRSITAPT